ncbi:MAG: hypothetical protein WBA88_21295 [Pseudaminobacter sp.]
MAIQSTQLNGSHVSAKSGHVAGLLPQVKDSGPLRALVVGGSGRRQGRYKYWTKDEIEDLKRLAEQHVRVTALARRFNRSVGAVRARASKEGISLIEKPNKTLPELPLPPLIQP